MQLPDSNVDSYFLKSFGRPERDKTCECERTAEPSVTQVLHIANGDTINKNWRPRTTGSPNGWPTKCRRKKSSKKPT